ncbi:MAG: hypothetical protein R3F34_20655 [Planctomycetota bacterium]
MARRSRVGQWGGAGQGSIPWRTVAPVLLVVTAVGASFWLKTRRMDRMFDRVTVRNVSSATVEMPMADAGDTPSLRGIRTLEPGESTDLDIVVASRTIRVTWSDGRRAMHTFEFEANDDETSRDRFDHYVVEIDDDGAVLVER